MDPRSSRSEQRHQSRTGTTFKRFVRDLQAVIDTDEVIATRTAASVLCHLSRRIHAGEAKDLRAQLPQKLQEIISECTLHERHEPDKFSRGELLARVGRDLNVPEDAAEHRIRGVFEVLSAHVSAGEILQVIHALPRQMWELWPRPIFEAVEHEREDQRDLSDPSELR